MSAVIPMLARPLVLLCGPPDPDDLMVPVVHDKTLDDAVWLAPARNHGINGWHVNPGHPGKPEPLPWKRRVRRLSDERTTPQ